MALSQRSLSLITLLITCRVSHGLNTQYGHNDWATYYEVSYYLSPDYCQVFVSNNLNKALHVLSHCYHMLVTLLSMQGDAPIIILSQHGGYEVPNTIPDREDGCWNTVSEDCIFEHDCEINHAPYVQSSSKCDVKTFRDAYTKEIATCLRDTIDIFDNNRGNIPHLVVNELKRSKLDPNRPIDEATLGNADATLVYNDIHTDFMEQAKTAVTNQCGFGLVLDIHGQGANDFNQLGYRLRDSDLEQDDATLNGQTSSSTIKYLAQNNLQNDDLATIVRGADSLGTIKNQTYSYLMVPSTLQPYLDEEYYYQGSTGILNHGSQFSGSVDAIQIEINSNIRWNQNNRDQFCIDFSRAIETFMNHYYDLSLCSNVSTTTAAPARINSKKPIADDVNTDTGNNSFATTPIPHSIFTFVLILIIIFLIVIKYVFLCDFFEIFCFSVRRSSRNEKYHCFVIMHQ